jgi:hypothetical protein
LSANSTHKYKTPFRDDDRSVYLEDDIAREIKVSNFDDLTNQLETLKKQVANRLSAERKAEEEAENQRAADLEVREALEQTEDSFLQTTQERLQNNLRKQEEAKIADDLGDYEDELKPVEGLESGLINEDDIEIIDDDDINYTLND